MTGQEIRDLVADLEHAERALHRARERIEGEPSADVESALHEITRLADRLYQKIHE